LLFWRGNLCPGLIQVYGLAPWPVTKRERFVDCCQLKHRRIATNVSWIAGIAVSRRRPAGGHRRIRIECDWCMAQIFAIKLWAAPKAPLRTKPPVLPYTSFTGPFTVPMALPVSIVDRGEHPPRSALRTSLNAGQNNPSHHSVPARASDTVTPVPPPPPHGRVWNTLRISLRRPSRGYARQG